MTCGTPLHPRCRKQLIQCHVVFLFHYIPNTCDRVREQLSFLDSTSDKSQQNEAWSAAGEAFKPTLWIHVSEASCQSDCLDVGVFM